MAHVCRLWRDIAIHVPALWDLIDLRSPEFLSEVLHRSEVPVELGWHESPFAAQRPLTILPDAEPLLSRVRGINLVAYHLNVQRLFSRMPMVMPSLTSVRVLSHGVRMAGWSDLEDWFLEVEAPQLQSIRVQHHLLNWPLIARRFGDHLLTLALDSVWTDPDVNLPFHDVLDTLEALPMLQELVMIDCEVGSYDVGTRVVEMPCLRELRIAGPVDFCAPCLRHVRPATREGFRIDVRCDDGNSEDPVDMIEQMREVWEYASEYMDALAGLNGLTVAVYPFSTRVTRSLIDPKDTSKVISRVTVKYFSVLLDVLGRLGFPIVNRPLDLFQFIARLGHRSLSFRALQSYTMAVESAISIREIWLEGDDSAEILGSLAKNFDLRAVGRALNHSLPQGLRDLRFLKLKSFRDQHALSMARKIVGNLYQRSAVFCHVNYVDCTGIGLNNAFKEKPDDEELTPNDCNHVFTF